MRDTGGRVVDFTWVYENAAIARLNGTDPEAVVGKRLLELFPGHAASPFLETYKHAAETGETRILEAFYNEDSVPMPIWFRVAVVSMEKDIAILAQDITERKQLEEELHRSRDELEVRVQERTAELNRYMAKLEQSNQALQDFASHCRPRHERTLSKVIVFWKYAQPEV